MLHNSYTLAGGEDVSVAAEYDALVARGHEVDLVRVSNKDLVGASPIKAGLEAVWSVNGARLVRECLSSKSYDLLHVQNFFFRLSPVVHRVADELGVPSVQHLRNFRLMCVNASLYRNGMQCYDCVGSMMPLKGVVHGCYRDSVSASAAVAAMIGLHKAMGTWKRSVTSYIAISNYVRDLHIAAGFPGDRIAVRHNLTLDCFSPMQERQRVCIVAARLVPEKGVQDVIEAWKLASVGGELLIAGEGPYEKELRRQAQWDSSIHFLGQIPHAELSALVGKARCLVVPSLWNEPFGRTALESIMLGTPVLASAVGGLPEILGADSASLYPPGDIRRLALLIKSLFQDEIFFTTETQAARDRYNRNFSIGNLMRQTEEIYATAINKKKCRS